MTARTKWDVYVTGSGEEIYVCRHCASTDDCPCDDSDTRDDDESLALTDRKFVPYEAKP